MKLFAPLYERCLLWANHRHAPWFLGGMSFAESSFFPIPVDVMLAPMALQRPGRWAWFALIAAVTSVLGGLFGYLIGSMFWDAVQPWVVQLGWMGRYDNAVDLIHEWGIWIVFLAGFTPVPYKVMTIAAGTLGMALLPFTFASIVGRGARFFLVAGLVAWAGPRLEPKIHKYIELIGWVCIILAVVAYLVIRA